MPNVEPAVGAGGKGSVWRLRNCNAVNKKAQINGWYIVAAVFAVLAIQQ